MGLAVHSHTRWRSTAAAGSDGYGVQDEPWFVLVSPVGRILWYRDIATDGWLSSTALAQQVRWAR
jgi:hypothetical protein